MARGTRAIKCGGGNHLVADNNADSFGCVYVEFPPVPLPMHEERFRYNLSAVTSADLVTYFWIVEGRGVPDSEGFSESGWSMRISQTKIIRNSLCTAIQS